MKDLERKQEKPNNFKLLSDRNKKEENKRKCGCIIS